MVKRKLLKTIGTMAVGVMLVGGTAMAATEDPEYNFTSMNTSETRYTSIYEKDGNATSGYVSRTSPDPTSTYIKAWFANKSHYRRSSIVTIHGIGAKNPSYSGFSVNDGDRLCLAVCNPTTENKGSGASAGGKFRL